MNLNQLKIFKAVAETKSFTGASKKLFMTQPGVSKHIKQLEEYFGISLFDRLGKRVVLTQAGSVLYESTKKFFRLLDDTELRINDLKGMTGGKITVGASYTAGIYIISNTLAHYQQMYPDIDLSLNISLSKHITDKILSNELDIGIIGSDSSDERLNIIKLLDDNLVVIIPYNHKWRSRKYVKASDLKDQPFIVSWKGSGTRTIVDNHFNKLGININKIIEFGNTESVKRAVTSGLGISILSEFSIKTEIEKGELITLMLSGTKLERSFYLAYRKDKYLIKPIKEIINRLMSELKNL